MLYFFIANSPLFKIDYGKCLWFRGNKFARMFLSYSCSNISSTDVDKNYLISIITVYYCIYTCTNIVHRAHNSKFVKIIKYTVDKFYWHYQERRNTFFRHWRCTMFCIRHFSWLCNYLTIDELNHSKEVDRFYSSDFCFKFLMFSILNEKKFRPLYYSDEN
jgi:hypothetical protein